MSGSSGTGNSGRSRGTASISVTWLVNWRASAGKTSRQKTNTNHRTASAGFIDRFIGNLGVGADLPHRFIHMRHPEEETVHEGKMPGHLARHVQKQNGAHIVR